MAKLDPEAEICADLLRELIAELEADLFGEAEAEPDTDAVRLRGDADPERLPLALADAEIDPETDMLTVPTEAVIEGESVPETDIDDEKLSIEAEAEAEPESEVVPIETVGWAEAVCGDCDPLALPDMVGVHVCVPLIDCVFE